MGSQRIVSKLGDLDSYGQDPRRIAYAGSDVDGTSMDFAGKYAQSQQTIKDRYADFEVPYNGKDNDDYVNGGGFCCDDNPSLRAGAIGAGNDNPETFQYYYHSDHLGSASLITNLDGEVVQHVEYVPFGEVFIEERNNKWNTPYLFNAKELDEETGLYYYGARYYDSRTSIFLGVDPMWEKYPGISVFAYCSNNPIKYIDQDGKDYSLSIDQENSIITVQATYYASSQDFDSAQQAVEYWNNQSDNFTYQTKEGNYSVQFILTAIGVETDASMTPGQIRSKLNAALSNDKSGIGNVYSVVADSKLDANTNGTTVGGNFVQVKDSRKNADTGAHEIGHTLGLTHSSNGVMTASVTNRRRNNTINTSDLKDMFSYPLRGKVNSENGNKAGKGTVQYFLPFRDYDPQYPSLSSKGKVKKRQ